MPPKSDENQALESQDLVFILAIAGRIDAQSRIFAKQLDKDRSIHYAYAVLDSLSSSYSMFKYFFDVFIPNSNSDTLHDFLLTPGGIVAASLEILFLVGFSVLAVKFDNEKEENIKKWIADAWPYIRDIIKGLKNAYKGWRSLVVALNLLGVTDLSVLTAPLGFALGIFAAANRYWWRSMVEERKIMMNANMALKSKIKQLSFISENKAHRYYKKIQYQKNSKRINAYISVALGGAIDGLYLYFGIIGLALLAAPMMHFLIALCAFYTLACIITRIYEEYDFQLRLLITQTQCKLEIIAKQIETTYGQLLFMEELETKTPQDLEYIKLLKSRLCTHLTEFEDKRKILIQQSQRTYGSAALFGLKNGLYAYGVITSALLILSTILLLAGAAFPPGLLIGSAVAGLVIIVFFVIHSLTLNYLYLQKQKIQEVKPYDQLQTLKNDIEAGRDVKLLGKDTFTDSLKDGLAVKASPQLFIQEWCEVLRSLFSGFSKGQKFIDFIGSCMLETDGYGHYHGSPFVYALYIFSAVIFGCVLAFRALARGFRVPLGQDTEPESSSATSLINEDVSEDSSDLLETYFEGLEEVPAPKEQIPEEQTPENIIPVSKPVTQPVPHNSSNRFGFFEIKSRKEEPDGENDSNMTPQIAMI